jgi:hypothetical protein
VSCRGHGFGPIGGWHGRLKEEGASDIIDGAYSTFRFAVLSGGVGTRESKVNEGGDGRVDELGTVIVLHSDEGSGKLGVHEGNKSNECGSGVGFMT